MQIAPSAYWHHADRQRNPVLHSCREQRDLELVSEVQRAWQANMQVYGADKVWVSDFTYVSTWQGWVYVAFVVDVFSRRIVGWRQSSSMHTEFVLGALEQALYDRKPSEDDDLIHHSDRGSQYLSIRYSERLAEAGIESSVGPKGDSYDNVLAETINGLYKAEVIRRRGPRKTKQAVELATLEWVAWFNHHRLMGLFRQLSLRPTIILNALVRPRPSD